MSIERWNNDTSRGWTVSLTIWRTRLHQWSVDLERDRVHRNGNHLWRLEITRISR